MTDVQTDLLEIKLTLKAMQKDIAELTTHIAEQEQNLNRAVGTVEKEEIMYDRE